MTAEQDEDKTAGQGGQRKVTFWGSAFYYMLGAFFSQGTTAVALLILSRLMSVEDYGMVMLYSLWIMIFGILIGIQGYSSLNNAKIDFGLSRLKEYTSVVYGFGVVTFILLLGVLLVFQRFLIPVLGLSLPEIVLCAAVGFLSFAINQISQKHRVLNQPVRFVLWTSLLAVLRTAFSIPIVLFMIGQGQRTALYRGDLLGTFLAYASVGLLATALIVGQGKKLVNWQWWKYCLAISMPPMISNLVLGQSDRYMLQQMTTLTEVGIYGYVFTIGTIVSGIWMAFNNVWSVWYFDKKHQGDKKGILNFYGRYCGFITMIFAVFILLSPDLIAGLGGAAYAGGWIIAPAMIAGLYFMFLYSFSVTHMVYKRKTVFIAMGAFVTAGVNILLNFVLIPRWGGLGAALSTLMSYSLLFLLYFVAAAKIVKDYPIPFKKLLYPALSVVAAMGITYIAMDAGWVVLRWVLAAVSAIWGIGILRKSEKVIVSIH